MPDTKASYDVREQTGTPEYVSVHDVVDLVIQWAKNPRAEHKDTCVDRTMATAIDTYGTDPIRTVIHRVLVDNEPFRTDTPDPFQYLLTLCDVVVLSEVATELRDSTQYQDIHAAATNNVLAARSHYTVETPYKREDTPDTRPTFGLDDGETDGIVLANALNVDGVLTDEFGGTNSPLIHAVLQGPRIVPTPRLIVDYARNGHLSHEAARTLLTTISPHRSWENGSYVS